MSPSLKAQFSQSGGIRENHRDLKKEFNAPL
jgi:hypothetical protein